MDAVESCDLYLDSLGEDGNDPVDFHVNFVAGSFSATSLFAPNLIVIGNCLI